MIERKIITLSDKEVFAKYFKNIDNSTYNFTNMFMWASHSSISYAEVCGCLVLFFQFGKNPVSASMPIGDGDFKGAVSEVMDYLKSMECRPVFRNLSNPMVEKIKSEFPNQFDFIYDRDSSDYIYETEKMITHSGKKLHGKRNHLNYFQKTYQYTYIDLTTNDMEECRALFDKWIDEKEDLKWLGSSRHATYNLIDNFDALGVSGGGIKIENELIAFSIGEQITEDMALIHIEFGDPNIRGAFNIINQQFCENKWKDLTYVNREEDMGLAGLRQAKSAYQPYRILEKYNAVFVG